MAFRSISINAVNTGQSSAVGCTISGGSVTVSTSAGVGRTYTAFGNSGGTSIAIAGDRKVLITSGPTGATAIASAGAGTASMVYAISGGTSISIAGDRQLLVTSGPTGATVIASEGAGTSCMTYARSESTNINIVGNSNVVVTRGATRTTAIGTGGGFNNNIDTFRNNTAWNGNDGCTTSRFNPSTASNWSSGSDTDSDSDASFSRSTTAYDLHVPQQGNGVNLQERKRQLRAITFPSNNEHKPEATAPPMENVDSTVVPYDVDKVQQFYEALKEEIRRQRERSYSAYGEETRRQTAADSSSVSPDEANLQSEAGSRSVSSVRRPSVDGKSISAAKREAAPAPQVGPESVSVRCPSCHYEGDTTIKVKAYRKTHLSALAICLLGGLLCWWIPYCVDSCQSKVHYCPKCNAYIGTYSK